MSYFEQYYKTFENEVDEALQFLFTSKITDLLPYIPVIYNIVDEDADDKGYLTVYKEEDEFSSLKLRKFKAHDYLSYGEAISIHLPDDCQGFLVIDTYEYTNCGVVFNDEEIIIFPVHESKSPPFNYARFTNSKTECTLDHQEMHHVMWLMALLIDGLFEEEQEEGQAEEE